MTRTGKLASAPLLLALVLSLTTGCRNKLEEPGPSADSAAADTAPAKTTDNPGAKTNPKSPKAPERPEIPAPKDVAAPPASAQKTPSGLAWVVLKEGTGKVKPTLSDKVTVHYTGWMKDGKMFDSSELRKRPATFGVTGVIKGWTEGLQLMTKGAKYRFWIPADLAYGETSRRPGGPSGQLTFDVELIDILAPPKTPEDVAAPSAGAKKTASGLAYKMLEEGKPNGKKPTPKNRVTVHYSGWTKDGKMFDSSVTRGQPATFGVTGVIKGWTEGLQLMQEGAKYRFWIPADLAYGEKPAGGRPAGQLTFDVELLGVR